MPDNALPSGVRTIQLTQGMVAIVDENDWESAARLRWHVSRDGNTWYAKRSDRIGKGKYRTIALHRYITNAPDGAEVDHINGDGLDNRRSNLRIATHKQNCSSRRKHRGESRFKGVCRWKNSWRSSIYVDGKKISLGCFRSQEDAARAYDRAAREHFGEFARTNVDLHGAY